MFWRLFLTYLLLVVLAVCAVGVVILQRTGGQELFLELSRDVTAAAVPVVLLAVLPAYILARRITRPLELLNEGARRLAEADFTQPIRAAGNAEVATLGHTFNAMSERLAASFRELAHDRERLRAILSGMVEGVVAIDNELRILFANDRAGQLLGFAPAVAVNLKVWEVGGPPAIRELVELALDSDDPQRRELDFGGASVAVYVSRLRGSAFTGAVLVLHDTTDLRRLERLRQDFVANVSHELKTPLANIKSSVEVLLDGAVEDPAARGMFLDEIAEQAERQQALIEDLLSLARIESSELKLDFRAVKVEDAVEACLDRHRTRAEAKGLTVDAVALAGSPADLTVWADVKGLTQVLDNLVDNAIKYTLQNGRVTVRWECAPETVLLEVEDSGIGIPEHDLPRIFERFYRVDKARSRDAGGTGLGLAIVKHLVNAMKGSVSVSSVANKGSTFTVVLPRPPKSGASS